MNGGNTTFGQTIDHRLIGTLNMLNDYVFSHDERLLIRPEFSDG
jgi:hypothetical protein